MNSPIWGVARWIAAAIAGAVPVVAAFAAPAPGVSPPASATRATATTPAIALLPRLAWSAGERPAGLDSEDVYVFRPDQLHGSRVEFEVEGEVGVEVAGEILDATLSPVGDLLAAFTRVPGNASAGAVQVVVADTSGDYVATLHGTSRARWRPDGGALAGAVGSTSAADAFDSVFVWDVRRHEAQGFRVPRSRGALRWDGTERLLVEPSPGGKPLAIDLLTGAQRTLKRPGTDLSPDGAYSIARSEKGWAIFDAAGKDLTVRAGNAIHRSGQWTAASWVAYPREGHLAVVAACEKAERSSCGAALLDVKRMRVVGRTKGRLLGVTSDGMRAVVFQDGAVRFLGREDWETVPAAAAGGCGAVKSPSSR